jgi:transcriptional regulator with XRE-family HTH domain
MRTPSIVEKTWRYTRIAINRLNMAKSVDNPLGTYLKNRRARLDPAAFGIVSTRRRTPGLRREEVAQRANVSVTWYTWLEQGRGGTPSADVLEGIANALALTAAEREHLFLLAQNRPPEVRFEEPEPVTPQLQRVLDSLPFSPALVKTVTWDVVAWNRAAVAVLTDYAALAPERRNILRLLFGDPHVRAKQGNCWESVARAAVAAFRAETARAGATERVGALVDDLRRSSPEFEAIWRDHDVLNYGEGVKRIPHSSVGSITLEYSAFSVDGRPDLSLVIYTPASPADTDRIKSLVGDPTA